MEPRRLLSYTGAPPPNSNASSDLVQIVELLHRDYTLVKVERRKKDKHGKIVQKAKMDEAGIPQFRTVGSHDHTAEDGTPFTTDIYQLEMEDVFEEVQVRKYPQWRRTTLLLPDPLIIDDCAWDYESELLLFSRRRSA